MRSRQTSSRFKGEHILRNEPAAAAQVRTKILHETEEKKYSLIEVYQYHNDQFEKLVGSEFSYGTYKKFKSALKSLKAFLEWKFKKKDVYLTENATTVLLKTHNKYQQRFAIMPSRR